jgi:hypothetical protein
LKNIEPVERAGLKDKLGVGRGEPAVAGYAHLDARARTGYRTGGAKHFRTRERDLDRALGLAGEQYRDRLDRRGADDLELAVRIETALVENGGHVRPLSFPWRPPARSG